MKLKINGAYYSFFTEGSINLKFDSIASTFALRARFNPENDDHKEIFKPLQYHKVEIFNDADKLIFTGIILNHNFESDKDVNLVSISGYSLSGILEDVNIPTSEYPLESNNRSLKDIAQRLCGFFDVGLVIKESASNDVNGIFKKTTASPTDKVKEYLSKLTSQKNIILSHDAKGRVVMFKPDDKAKPKYYFNKDNALKMSSSFNGQGLHSQISVVRQPSKDNAGVSTVDSITNPLIKPFRPTTKVLSSGEDTDTKKAADNELGAELKNITVKVELNGLWDNLFPGDLVNIHEHGIYSFAYTRWFVDSVDLTFNEKEDRTVVNCVLPETFTGKQPKPILFYYKSHKNHN